jgi:cell division protein ZapA (FtsZ GTPase activity inhibitor)
MSTQAEVHARSTIGEIARLVQIASEAPRAAADLVAQLRDKLSESMSRDNTLLEERSRIMAALNTLLDAVRHTSVEQRAAIDQLVGSAAAWLEQAGQRFNDKVDAESSRMEAAAAQLGSSAVEVASLGEAFGAAVEGFSQSSDRLMTHLQRVDDTLGKAIVRSDEQLAYYVAQAREVIDLSLASQKQIVDDLQRIAGRHTAQA